MRIELSDETMRLVKMAVERIEEVPWDQRDWNPATTALVAIGNAIARSQVSSDNAPQSDGGSEGADRA